MQHIEISYSNDFTEQNFKYSTNVETEKISGILNVMVGVLRLIGYGDNLIEDMIGDTYFPEDYCKNIDAATDEAINEYMASKINEGWDEPNDQAKDN